MVKVTIDGKEIEVSASYTIMEAAYEIGIEIPRLCFLKDINETSACRICVVEIEGIRTLKNSCTVKVNDGMVVRTNTDRVHRAVKTNLELIAGNHRFECWKCTREHNCELLRLLRKYNISNVIGEDADYIQKKAIINITDAIELDSTKCILCGRCVSACEYYSGTKVLDFNDRGFGTYIGPASNHPMDDTGCIYCGKCIQACPTGALKEHEEIEDVIEALNDSNVYTIVQIAPSVRAALGEEFGYKIGTNVEGKIYRALKILGFNDITDTNYAADLTIMEEGTELISRIKKLANNEDVVLPMFTSCSPGWVRYLEIYYPEFIPNLSTCKSPQQMQGAIIKNYYADKIGVDKKKIKVISVMPCIAKKAEAKLPEMEVDGIRDVDMVITTRELARLIKRMDIPFTNLEDYVPQSPLSKYTGAGAIFGVTGGVMEAALRTVYRVLEGKEMDKLDIIEIRGVDNGIKEAVVKIAGMDLNVAIVHGTVNVPEMLEKIKKNPKKYAFVEFMGCTGGCVNGGGQPIISARMFEKIDVRKERAKALYSIDKNADQRASHINPEIQKLYDEFLGKPNSKKAHHLLHTSYVKKGKYTKE